jgi:hypothetical protein
MRARLLTARLALAVFLLGLMSVGITAATTTQAAIQLFKAEWYTNSFGNFCRGAGTTGPHCTKQTGVFAEYSNWNLPQNQNCNPNQPRCPFQSTPVSKDGAFAPLGGSPIIGQFCAPWSNWNGGSFSQRPAKGATITSGPPPTGMNRPVPPLYRNPHNFTTSGAARTTQCTEKSTGFTTQNKGFWGNNKGRVHIGDPIDGTWNAVTTGAKLGDFSIPIAPPHNHKFGLEQSGIQGSFTNLYPHVYSYTYINFRNAAGVFGPGKGVGSFEIIYPPQTTTMAGTPVATVKQFERTAAKGNKFGGTMEMLGALTTKVCYYFQGGCSLGENRWRYDAIGASGLMRTSYPSGKITGGAIYSYTAIYYHTAMKAMYTITAKGSRFPWTTGSITVAATGRGPGDTVHYAHGYDNRNTTTSSGKGTIQLVSPILTRWFGTKTWETGGIATLRIKFVPEPQMWAMLVAGASLLGVGARMRGR